jgi:exosome complex RNA-binding protein Rrp42 (RNase PH superfamily)
VKHLPVPLTFGLFESAETTSGGQPQPNPKKIAIADPTHAEEEVMATTVTVVLNSDDQVRPPHQQGNSLILLPVLPLLQLCGVHKPGGTSVSHAQLQRCIRLAQKRLQEVEALWPTAADEP